MNTKFTPGPWEYDGNGRVDAVEFRKPTGHICEDGSEYIGGLVALPYHCGDGTREANACLISAAPTLLAALQFAVAEADAFGLAEDECVWLAPARTAIATALGQVEQDDQIAEAA